MVLNDEQIKQIALCIVYDVHQYIIEHQLEYEAFLSEEAETKEKEKILNEDTNQI